MPQPTLFDYDIEGKTWNPDALKPAATVPDKVIPSQNKENNNAAVTGERIYNTEYLCQLISKDLSIFDIRGWPRGINRKEFDALWENNFEPQNDDPWFAGHFAFAMREAKRLFRADKDKVWDYVLINKKPQFERWMQIYHKDAENHWKTANTSNTPADVEYWLEHCHTTWSELNTVIKELGLPEEPLPEKYKIALCDPMKWGEEKKTDTVKIIRKKKEKVQNTSTE